MISRISGSCLMCYWGTRDSLFPLSKIPWESYFINGHNGHYPSICTEPLSNTRTMIHALQRNFSDDLIIEIPSDE